MFTVVSSFQSTVALHKTPLYILHYEASERSAVSYTHSGITGTGCSTGAMSATSAAKSTGGSISSCALCIQTQGSAIHPFPVGKGEGIGNRSSRLVVRRDRFPLFFHSFFSPLNNLCRAAAVLQWRKHSMLPVFPIQQRGNSQNVILSQSFYLQPEGYVHAVAATADVYAICLQPCPFLSR